MGDYIPEASTFISRRFALRTADKGEKKHFTKTLEIRTGKAKQGYGRPFRANAKVVM